MSYPNNNPPAPEAPAGIGSAAPFSVQLRSQDPHSGEAYRPETAVLVSPALRTSGLLITLAPEDLKNLVFALTFVSPDGTCRPTLPDLAEAMRVSAAKAASRMDRLAGILWQGEPLIALVGGGGTPDAYEPSPRVLSLPGGPEIAPAPGPSGSDAGQAPAVSDGQEAAGAYPGEYRLYPPSGVEPQLTDGTGWEQEETPAALRRRLQAVGVTDDQAAMLLASYDPERIGRQLGWLPYRNANNPPAFLVAAIEEDYEEPLAMRAPGQPWHPDAGGQGGAAANSPDGA